MENARKDAVIHGISIGGNTCSPAPGRPKKIGRNENYSERMMKKCPRPDLNWHRDLTPQRILSPVRLPIPPLGHFNRRQITERRMEARGGIEPPISVLQTDALPLCYRAQL